MVKSNLHSVPREQWRWQSEQPRDTSSMPCTDGTGTLGPKSSHNDYHYKPSSRAQTLWVRGQEGNKYVKYPTTVFGNSTRYTTPLLLVKFVSEINYCSGSRSHDLGGTACPGCMACILPGPNGVVIYHCRVHNSTLNAQNEWQLISQ